MCMYQNCFYINSIGYQLSSQTGVAFASQFQACPNLFRYIGDFDMLIFARKKSLSMYQDCEIHLPNVQKKVDFK